MARDGGMTEWLGSSKVEAIIARHALTLRRQTFRFVVMRHRRFVSGFLLLIIAAASPDLPPSPFGYGETGKVRRHRIGEIVFAQAPATLRSTDLAGLRLRGIGPATMSGRFVDMDVVESNPYIMYVASATGGMYRTTDNGITRTPAVERGAVHSIGDVAIYQPRSE